MNRYLEIPFEDKWIVDFDVESTGLQPWNGTQRAFLYQFLDDDGLLEVLRPENDWDRIQWWFDRVKEHPNGFIRAWNSNFDKSFAYVAGFDIPGDGYFLDGMLEAHAIDENRSVALKAVSDNLLGEGASDLQKEVKAWMTKEQARRKKESIDNGTEKLDVTYEDVPAELMEKYGAEDVILTRKVGDIYAPKVEQVKSLREIVALEHDVLDALFHVQRRGFPVDESGYRKLEIEIANNVEALADKVEKMAEEVGIEDFNPKSSMQVIAALKARKADLSHVSEKNGKLSADAENLATVDDELAAAILEFRGEAKAHGTYVKPYIMPSYVPSMRMHKQPFIAKDSRIHANYRQIGAKTGRMSCCISEGSMVDAPRDLLAHPNGIAIEDVQVGSYVYSFNSSGVPRPKKVLEHFNNGVRPVLKLVYRRRGRSATLGSLEATPDHMIGLADGTYRRLDQLKTGDKLGYMARSTYTNRNVYSNLSWNGSEGTIPEHRHLVNEGDVVHHRDENSLNNSLNNLQGMSISDHTKLHNPLGMKRPERNRQCPYPAEQLSVMLESGIKNAISSYGHDFVTWKRWSAEANIDVRDFRVLHADLPIGPDEFLLEWDTIGVRAIMEKYGVGTYTAYKWKDMADKSPVLNHEVVAVIDENKSVTTYDLTIEDTHNFVVNEIHVHNSDPNLQNQPRDDLRLRYNLRAEEGMKLVTCDLSNVEMRVFAAYAGEGALLRTINEGGDIHTLTAEMIGIRDRARTGGHIETARQRGKTFNFCVPKHNTEILTQRGWLRFNKVEVGDLTVGFNPDTARNEWTEITSVIDNGMAPTMNISSGSFKVTTTPDHRWLGWKRRDGGARGRYIEDGFVSSNDITSEHTLRLSAPFVSDRGNCTPQIAGIVGWLVSDGNGFDSIFQSNKHGIKEIERLLEDVDHSVYTRPTGVKQYYIKAQDRKSIWEYVGGFESPVEFVVNMDRSSLTEFMKAIYYAEGLQDGGQHSFAQNHDNEWFDAMVLGAYLMGDRPTISGNARGKGINLSKPYVTGQGIKKNENVNQDTWCVETGLGTWTMRQNNVICLTGNSVVYGGGIRTIMKQQRCSQDDARRYLQRYKDAYPEVVRLQNRIAYKLQDQGYISSLWGRRFRVDQRDSYKGVNYLVQGTAADLLKASLVRLHEEGCPVIALVHDEIIAMVPEDEAESTRDQIIKALTDHPKLTDKVPLEAEGDIVDRWSQAKDPNFIPKWARGAVDLSGLVEEV